MHNDNEHDLIKAAQEALGDSTPLIEECSAIPVEFETTASEHVAVVIEQSSSNSMVEFHPAEHSSELTSYQHGAVSEYIAPHQPATSGVTSFQKFGDIPTQLREEDSINLQEIKKLNLASTVEALERALQSQENFPSPDAAFAVASLSEQVLKLTKDLEKTLDPRAILEDIMTGAISRLTQEIVQDLAGEMKRLLIQSLSMCRDDKKEAFEISFKEAVNRMGPAMKERLEVSEKRIAKALNIKDKPRAGS